MCTLTVNNKIFAKKYKINIHCRENRSVHGQSKSALADHLWQQRDFTNTNINFYTAIFNFCMHTMYEHLRHIFSFCWSTPKITVKFRVHWLKFVGQLLNCFTWPQDNNVATMHLHTPNFKSVHIHWWDGLKCICFSNNMGAGFIIDNYLAKTIVLDLVPLFAKCKIGSICPVVSLIVMLNRMSYPEANTALNWILSL